MARVVKQDRNSRKTLTRVLAGAVLAGSLWAIPPAPATAQGLLDMIFNTAPWREHKRKQAEEKRRLELPKVRVSAPKYYAYRADALRRISFKPLERLQVAANHPAPATDAEAELNGTVEIPELSPFDAARIHLKSLNIRALPEISTALIAHYKANPAFIWITDGKVNERAGQALAALQSADQYGLYPEDYKVEMPFGLSSPEVTNSVPVGSVSADPESRAQATVDPEENTKRLMAFEMSLSARVLSYVIDAQRGRIDPNRISGYHDLPRKKVNLDNVLIEIAAAEDAAAYLTARQPVSPHFQAMVKELARLKSEGEGVVIDIKPGTLLKPGRKNAELGNVLAAIRHRASPDLLAKHQPLLDAYQGGEEYTAELVALVKDYQRENGLAADGIVGRKTIRTLMTMSNAEKIRKVRLAMERARWLPGELGTRHVFVNQPAYTATYMQNGRPELAMRVVVGKKSNQTSFFYDEIEIVEYHPYWGVPRSIIVNEMLPKLYNDPSYFDRAGYEVTTVTGRRVSSSSVDWAGVATKRVPINVRQLPGRSNALGELKILFPNKHAIYMHDTPAKSLFKRDRRAFSHGCIRLHDPRAMAAAVLGKDKDYIASRIAQGKNDQDLLEDKVPVYVSYFTAWPSSDGSVRYFDDVYDRDKRLLRAQEITSKARKS